VGELFAPVSGEVLEANDAVVAAPELVNSDPFGSGWLLRVRVSDASRIDHLLDASAYAALIGDEA
jgi:glycine cleavage system H protein